MAFSPVCWAEVHFWLKSWLVGVNLPLDAVPDPMVSVAGLSGTFVPPEQSSPKDPSPSPMGN